MRTPFGVRIFLLHFGALRAEHLRIKRYVANIRIAFGVFCGAYRHIGKSRRRKHKFEPGYGCKNNRYFGFYMGHCPLHRTAKIGCGNKLAHNAVFGIVGLLIVAGSLVLAL